MIKQYTEDKREQCYHADCAACFLFSWPAVEDTSVAVHLACRPARNESTCALLCEDEPLYMRLKELSSLRGDIQMFLQHDKAC